MRSWKRRDDQETLIYPKNDSVGLSNMFEISCSKSWATTAMPGGLVTPGISLNTGRDIPDGFNKPIQFFPSYVAISPQPYVDECTDVGLVRI